MNKKLISLALLVAVFGCMTIKTEEQPTKVTRKDSANIKKVPFLNRLFNGKNNKVAGSTQQTETATKN